MKKILTLLLLLPLALSAASGRGADYVVEVDRSIRCLRSLYDIPMRCAPAFPEILL